MTFSIDEADYKSDGYTPRPLFFDKLFAPSRHGEAIMLYICRFTSLVLSKNNNNVLAFRLPIPVAQMERDLQISRATVFKMLKELEDAKLIKAYTNPSKFAGNLYLVTHIPTLEVMAKVNKDLKKYIDALPQLMDAHDKIEVGGKKIKGITDTTYKRLVDKLNDNQEYWGDYKLFSLLVSKMNKQKRDLLHAVLMTYRKIYGVDVPMQGEWFPSLEILLYAFQPVVYDALRIMAIKETGDKCNGYFYPPRLLEYLNDKLEEHKKSGSQGNFRISSTAKPIWYEEYMEILNKL